MSHDIPEPENVAELAARRRMSFQRSPSAVSSRGIFGDVKPKGRFRFLVSAVAAFSGRGFHATTTRDIAQMADASSASLYTYYESKADLLYEASLITFQYVIDMMRDVVERGLPPAACLAELVREFLRFHAEERIVVLVVNRDFRSLGIFQLAELLRMVDEIHQIVESVITDGVEQGVFVIPDIPTATRAVLRLADVSVWFNERLLVSLDQVAEDHVVLILQMLGHVNED